MTDVTHFAHRVGSLSLTDNREPIPSVLLWTAEVKTITEACTSEEASTVMLTGHLRHLPVLGSGGQVLGLLSIRALLEERLQDLSREVSALEQYMTNDGPGG